MRRKQESAGSEEAKKPDIGQDRHELSNHDLDAVVGGTGGTASIKLGDVKGDSTDGKHKDWIEVSS
jgi:hypothetical protein